ncbi:hypothetical protein Poly24_42340 [Rosistilla carotiformis]|uniref:Uncharacterized protein n=1 Tax=Rosistilla carotiformis TaxID=2528017 RepID=A0A518JY92_9BACT|nr:hypothetical protein [Rosistilla carotiformis]QDV70510.1 hypothetical protein Poly24_42340 [Rosistilla carotiformis]
MIRDNTPELVRKANAAMQQAANDVLVRARQHNTPIVLWRDGKVVEVDPFSEEFDPPSKEPPAAGTE